MVWLAEMFMYKSCYIQAGRRVHVIRPHASMDRGSMVITRHQTQRFDQRAIDTRAIKDGRAIKSEYESFDTRNMATMMFGFRDMSIVDKHPGHLRSEHERDLMICPRQSVREMLCRTSNPGGKSRGR